MALILPTTDDLNNYIEGQSDDSVIQQAMDLFVMATGLDATSSPLEDRIVKNAVLEMSWALKERHDSKDEEFSQSSGERIGSYSYNKAARSISEGVKTGVSAFDSAVDYFLMQALGGTSGVSSEWVFAREDFLSSRLVTAHDPSFIFEATDAWPIVSPPPVFLEDDVDYNDIPAGSTITLTKTSGGVWPGTPTDRADTIIIWKGAEPSPPEVSVRVIGQPGMLSGVDLRVIS